jgi:hypothetical protein
VQHHEIDSSHARVVGVPYVDLRCGREFDECPGAGKLATSVGVQREAHVADVGLSEELAAEEDVDGDGADLRYLERVVQLDDEGGYVRDGDAAYPPLVEVSDGTDGADRGVSMMTSRKSASGSTGTRPVSMAAVTAQMVLLPDMGVKPPCSRTTMPKSDPGSTAGNMRTPQSPG